jgi:hypothetical protein
MQAQENARLRDKYKKTSGLRGAGHLLFSDGNHIQVTFREKRNRLMLPPLLALFFPVLAVRALSFVVSHPAATVPTG